MSFISSFREAKLMQLPVSCGLGSDTDALVSYHTDTRCHNPEDPHLHLRRREN